MRKCECGIEITKEQDKENERIAKESRTKKVNMCADCWNDYTDHVLTGN